MAEINENGQDDTSLQDEFDGEADTEQAEAEVTAANPDESGIEDPVLILRVLVFSRLTFSRPIHFPDLTCSQPTLSLPVYVRYLTFSLPVRV